MYFQTLKNLTVGTLRRAKLHHRAKFRRNRSKYGRDVAIFRFFKMSAAAIMDFQIWKFLTDGTLKRVKLCDRAIFYRNNGRDMAIFRFLKMAAAVVLDFQIL